MEGTKLSKYYVLLLVRRVNRSKVVQIHDIHSGVLVNMNSNIKLGIL